MLSCLDKTHFCDKENQYFCDKENQYSCDKENQYFCDKNNKYFCDKENQYICYFIVKKAFLICQGLFNITSVVTLGFT